MKRFIRLSIYSLVLLQASAAFSQQIKFNRVLEGAPNGWQGIKNIAQDQEGYLWFNTFSNGFYQYDGSTFKSFTHDSTNKNSVSDNSTSCLAIDKFDNIWIGTFGSGINRFDPVTSTFTHFRHNPKNISSLANDSVYSILADHLGNIWIGTQEGLDRLDTKTGKFYHYKHDKSDASSLSSGVVYTIYEDRQGTIWAGCTYDGDFPSTKSEIGGLNRFDRVTEKFTQYKHSPADGNSLTDNNVTAIFEDSKGNFWVGTCADGLHTMDRTTGKFTHYPYDPSHPEKLSRPPLATGVLAIYNLVTLIMEDHTGAIWIGGLLEGINRYDPISKKVTHYGHIIQPPFKYIKKDTVSGFNEPNGALGAITTKDGLLWIGTQEGNLYNINLSPSNIPYYNINIEANSFLQEDDSVLWVATSNGLLRRNKKTGIDKKILHDPDDPNTLSHNNITTLRMDATGNLWIGTWGGGINKFDPKKNIFKRYNHDPAGYNSLSGDSVSCLHIDREQNMWLGVNDRGLDKIDLKSGRVSHYRHDDKNANSLISSNYFSSISEDKKNNIWIGTPYGLDMLDQKTSKFYHYLVNSEIISVFADASGDVWAGSTNGFYRLDRNKNKFTEYIDLNSPVKITGRVSHILEDDERNLWLSTANNIIKISAKRNSVSRYGKSYGVHTNTFYVSDNYKAKNGEIFIGDQNGYYSFFPHQLKETQPPKLNITGFKLGNQEIMPGEGSVLKGPIWQTKAITLNHNQNIFSFDFKAIDYIHPHELKYFFMLEDYDNDWHDLGSDHRAHFFNVPPGHYILHVKAINSEGAWAERVIAIIISPPWWRTWWAYTIFALSFIGLVWGFIYYRSRALRRENRILEEKVTQRTDQLNQSLEELKAAQTQLIHSAKMASLGELTAGIAHEIQNPLNFVNNFSDVNQELLEEMKLEIDQGNIEEVKALANDVIENEQKINNHGKRADAIVKGMLQHSRISTGQKEPTDINKLADEYLRLSYHGMRAKDKSFNAEIKTDFDENIGKINVVPQDMGRVLLNLYNNAFYAVNEKEDR